MASGVMPVAFAAVSMHDATKMARHSSVEGVYLYVSIGIMGNYAAKLLHNLQLRKKKRRKVQRDVLSVRSHSAQHPAASQLRGIAAGCVMREICVEHYFLVLQENE